ncbi:MAG: glycosyltransferase family 2 protein [Xanthomonadaceae bacterium]|nr:glycosyltransferase family 2 protein [Xanthomonadaceae bacterium]
MKGMDAGRVTVVIPCYKVSRHVLDLLDRIGPEVEAIVVVDDACPEGTGALVQAQCLDARVQVLFHAANQGVGGAVMTGYRHAIAAGADVIVKLDGDGQMDPALLGRFIAPILEGDADYTKGNRFHDLRNISRMPKLRLFGNAGLSFLNKLSTGYWDIFDPTNGYTAISAQVAVMLPLDRISQRYFFESDLLFRLGTFRAVVRDVPMDAQYGDEVSNLSIGKVLPEFLFKHVRNTGKRIFYNYYLRDLTAASLELLLGAMLLLFGVGYGSWHWWQSLATGKTAATGVIMLPAMTVLMGMQLLLAFLSQDIAGVPRRVLTRVRKAGPAGGGSGGVAP